MDIIDLLNEEFDEFFFQTDKTIGKKPDTIVDIWFPRRHPKPLYLDEYGVYEGVSKWGWISIQDATVWLPPRMAQLVGPKPVIDEAFPVIKYVEIASPDFLDKMRLLLDKFVNSNKVSVGVCPNVFVDGARRIP